MSLWVAPGSVAEESSSGSGGAYTPAHGEPTKVRCEIGTLCVIRTADGFRAIDDMCTHETASLSEGEYYDDTDEIECRCTPHASTFDCRSGQPRLVEGLDPPGISYRLERIE